jgi:transcriptional regulator with XRE-family HTH domain
MEIGQKIKEARIAKGLTQAELGKLVDKQKSAIAKYESGRVKNIKRSTLQKLAVALDLRGSDLIIESDPKEAATLHAKVLLDSDLMIALEQYYELSDEKKKMVRDLIRSLAE